MPAPLINHLSDMLQHAGKSVNRFGLDQTGKITYRFNQQGFRGSLDHDFVPKFAFFGCSLVFGIGVKENATFIDKFQPAHNYGLAGNYDDLDVYQTIKRYVENFGRNSVAKIIVWKNKSGHDIAPWIDEFEPYGFYHFMCFGHLSKPRCYSYIKNLDFDVSGTHPGPKTHQTFAKILCKILDQS